MDPSAPGSSRTDRPHGKRSSSSSRSGGRKRFRGGKGSAPSSKPSGFRKWEPSPYLTLSGGCLSLHWQAWRDRGADPWVVEVLRYGYRIPFLPDPPLSKVPIPMPSYHPLSTKGVALGEVTQALIAKSAVELPPFPSLGFYSRLFVVWKTSGSWSPVIDLSTLILFVDVSHFRMETIQSVLLSVRQGDWMASIDLKEAYLQIPVHPESRRFLRFVAHGQMYQFTALCFGLSTAPQVFSRVMAPVSAIFHSWGIRMRRYLDDWLVQSSSRDSLIHDLQVVLDLCRELGIVVNPEKSHLKPSQVVQYLGVVIDAQSFKASPSPDRIARLQSTAGEFLSSADPPASIWLSLLGMLSSLSHLVPGGRLRVRSLQLCLHRSWDRVDQSTRIPWSQDCLRDLRWWLHVPCLSLGVSLQQVSPDLDFWSDASDVGWGAHLGLLTASSLWSLEECLLSINTRELLAVRRGLLHFQSSLVGRTISVYCDNSTAVSYLRREGGTRSPFLNSLAQSPSLSTWLPSSSRGLSVFWWTLYLALTSSPIQSGPSIRRSFDLSVVCGWSKSTCLQPPRIANAPSFSLPSGIRWQPAWTRSFNPGTVFRLMRFLLGPSFPEFWRNSGNLGGRSSPWWLRIGLSDPGFPTSFTCRWPLRLLCLYVQTSCACLGLAAFTRVSTGCVFMPGDSPALHESCRVLFHCSLPGFLVATPIFAQGLSTQVAGLQGLVPLSRSLGLSTFPV